MAYPCVAVVNVFFVVYWAFRWRAYMFLSLISLLIGWEYFIATFQVRSQTEDYTGANRLKILSYNVRLFDLYKWTDDIDAKKHMINFIQLQHADIICLQEYYSRDKDSISNTTTIAKLTNSNYWHVEYNQTKLKKSSMGIATFCNYPILDKGRLQTSAGKLIGIFSDLKIGKQIVRVYNIHLASVNLGYEDYNFLDSFELKNDNEQVKGVIDILAKLNRAFIRRSKEVDLISSHINSSTYPVVVCGDFNDTPVSYTYRKIKGKLKDAFVIAGSGFGNTYVNEFYPFRIDYIFLNRRLVPTEFKIHWLDYSDHYPISCKIRID